MSQRQRRLKARRRSRGAVTGLAVGVTIVSGTVTAEAAQADPFTVTNTANSGAGSLRQAIHDANNHAGADQILFAAGVSGQINVQGSRLEPFYQSVDVQGPGANVLSVSGGSNYRVLDVDAYGGNVTVSGLTIKNGDAGGSVGGGVLVDGGHLTLSDSVVTGNEAAQGGGIYLDGNRNYADSLKVEHSTISGNTATNGDGGGIGAGISKVTTDDDAGGSIEVNESTISGNHAPNGNGGGISLNTYASGYMTGTYPDYYFHFSHAYLDAQIRGTTIAGNDTAGLGGGISAVAAHGSYGYARSEVVLRNSIVANDTGVGGANDTDTSFGTIQGDFSLVEADKAPVNPINETSMIFGKDPELGPLQDNGGPTPTMALPKTSPAVDKSNGFGVTTDQRGLPREADWQDVPNSTARPWDGTDMGAFELQLPPPPPPPGEQVFPAECNSTEATKQGTGGNDVISGTPARDVIQGLGGNDTIRGLGGNDLLCGGAGKDKLVGGAGKDILFGEAGGDTLLGGPAADFLLGGAGGDKLGGGGGKDSLLGGGGKDKLNGGPGKDLEKQ